MAPLALEQIAEEISEQKIRVIFIIVLFHDCVGYVMFTQQRVNEDNFCLYVPFCSL